MSRSMPMKCVIFAGGKGTRLSEETNTTPKPLVPIGGFPVIWHIMKIYSSYGINDFIVLCGYKSYSLKEYFLNLSWHNSDIRIDTSTGSVEVLKAVSDNWKVTLIDTGEDTMTGGRLKRVAELLDCTFCLTYGDGVANVNIKELIAHHRRIGSLATVTAVKPIGRFGILKCNDTHVTEFSEKAEANYSYVNGGFFVVEPSVIDYIENDSTLWEAEPLQALAEAGELSLFRHDGFWHPMDTLRDKNYLNSLWVANQAPWKVW